MNIFEFLSSASIGAIFALLLQSLFSFLSEERKHTLELKKRYFDKKIDTTLNVLNSSQWIIANLEIIINTYDYFVNEKIDVSLAKFTILLTTTELLKCYRDPKSRDTTITFYYGDDLRKLYEEIEVVYKNFSTSLEKLNEKMIELQSQNDLSIYKEELQPYIAEVRTVLHHLKDKNAIASDSPLSIF